MRILLPIDRIGNAGIGRVTRDLCRWLPEVLPPGDRLITVGGRPPCSTAPPVTHVVTSRPPLNRLGRFIHEQAVLARAARRADLVHLTDQWPVIPSRRPFLITIHDVFFLDHPEWYSTSIRQYKIAMLRVSLAKQPGAIVCVSEYARSRLLSLVPDVDRDRVHVVHPGVEVEDAPRDGDGEGEFFLTVSSIEPRKNHLLLLEAFRRARARGLSLRWKVVGAPLYGGDVVAAQLSRSAGVEYAGLVSDDERERLYRTAMFVALPSLAEGFGLTPLEAMARGVPAICSSGSALDETAGDAALRVDPGDADAWADALLLMAADADLRAELRERGLARVRTFDPHRSARRYAEIYHAGLP